MPPALRMETMRGFKPRTSDRIAHPSVNFASLILLLFGLCLALTPAPAAEPAAVVEVEGQPLAANAQRLLEALEFVGAPMPAEVRAAISSAAAARDARKLQEALDPQVLCVVTINPEFRVKA